MPAVQPVSSQVVPSRRRSPVTSAVVLFQLNPLGPGRRNRPYSAMGDLLTLG
jgi:hypothetical protein